jgi:hypothetical protein
MLKWRPSTRPTRRCSRRLEQATSSTWCSTWTRSSKSITVNEADLKTYYDQNAARLAAKEERRASHILITCAQGSAPAAERDKARPWPRNCWPQVRKAPDSLPTWPSKNSQDPGSAASGGDLDFFARGAMVKPFEDAAFAMKKGDISDVVESEFGYHIIQLTDIKTPKQRSFEEMRPDLEADLKKQQAQRKFAESGRSLHQRRLRAGGQPQAGGGQAQAGGPHGHWRDAPARPRHNGRVLANAKFLTALFSPTTRSRRSATPRRWRRPQPAGVWPHDAVHAGAHAAAGRGQGAGAQRLVAARAAELAARRAREKLAAWKAAPRTAVAAPGHGVLARKPEADAARRSLMPRCGRTPGAAGVGRCGPGSPGLCRGQGATASCLAQVARKRRHARTARSTCNGGPGREPWRTTTCSRSASRRKSRCRKPVAAARDDARCAR